VLNQFQPSANEETGQKIHGILVTSKKKKKKYEE